MFPVIIVSETGITVIFENTFSSSFTKKKYVSESLIFRIFFCHLPSLKVLLNSCENLFTTGWTRDNMFMEEVKSIYVHKYILFRSLNIRFTYAM